MASPEVENPEAEFIVGRQGLKLPNIDYSGEDRRLSDATVIDFFHKLWELNDRDASTELPYDGRSYKSRPYNHELVLPASEDSLLVLIRGSYKPKDSKELEYELRKDEERGHNNSWGVSVGAEEHTILLPPKEMGEFVPFLGVTDSHYRGGNRMSSGISVSWQDKMVREKDFEADISQPDVQEYWRQTRENYSKFIGGIIKETIEFLS